MVVKFFGSLCIERNPYRGIYNHSLPSMYPPEHFAYSANHEERKANDIETRFEQYLSSTLNHYYTFHA